MRRIAPLAEAAGLRIAILTGRDKGPRARATRCEHSPPATIDIVVGTHALFQEGVVFHDLALAVVDEQHRFGVHQRLALAREGRRAADMLVMTATPIPRTLVLTYFGDMDVSQLTEKPAGRQPIDTRAVPLERIGEVVERIGRAIAERRRASTGSARWSRNPKTIELAAGEERFADAEAAFSATTVGLVHGRMKGRDKDEAMAPSSAARRASWSPRRSSRSASTCRMRRSW